MPDPAIQEVLDLNARLLSAIAKGDWHTYEDLCDPTLTCFEPEAKGHLVKGLEFHRFYFDLGPPDGPRNTTMASPKVRIMGEVAVVTYIRLVQYLDESGAAVTSQFEETRVWQVQDGRWQHVHFHRSPVG
jgi:calcium/calmodulin-dependent protein kinase (CaM kinase) II